VLAQRHSRPTPALFLDCDGVIIEDRDHICELPDNRWIKLAELFPGKDWKMAMQLSSVKGIVHQQSHFVLRLGACSTLLRGPAAALETLGLSNLQP
jgi:hypothetical protein